MIQLQDVSYCYSNNRNVFEKLTLQLHEPGIYGLLGLNGIGKTTLLTLLSSLTFANEGTILLQGSDISKREESTLERLYYMPSDIDDIQITFSDFVAYYSPLYPTFNPTILNDCLSAFHVRSDEKLHTLSLGEKKKALLSFSIAVQTDILMLDEPTNGLDIPSKKIFRQLLMRHIKEHQIVIIATHLIADISNLIDSFIIVKDASSVFSATAASLTTRYAFTLQSDTTDAIYSEPCAKGFRVIKNHPLEDADTDIDVELLFNAVLKGQLS